MDVNAVMDEIATRLGTIPGLRIHDHPPGSVTPPAGIVSFPERIDFDETYGRGMDRIRDLPVVVVVGKATDRTARVRINEYASAIGAKSVKAVLEATPHFSFHTIRVASVEFDVVTIGSVDYIAALFAVDIAGQGTT